MLIWLTFSASTRSAVKIRCFKVHPNLGNVCFLYAHINQLIGPHILLFRE